MILEHVVPWGRNLTEYQEMFALSDVDLQQNILGCSDGPSSFNKELTSLGGMITSIDPVYEFTKDQILQRIKQTSQTIVDQVRKTKDDFVWNTIKSVEALKEIRLSAMGNFLDDYDKGKEEQRYIKGALPNLPFEADHFDLVLCSHFLFLYSDHFDLKFHIDSVKAMSKVGKEVRIFPLLDLKGERSHYLDPLMKVLEDEGHQCLIVKVDYEFQKGGNEMLKITL
ncbi:MAG: SAM-dependent methyltransferase [Thiovulaceae bacterium]|nr:SAM-dependent methyltransferase [Sulfurimonadaceae bacterium]